MGPEYVIREEIIYEGDYFTVVRATAVLTCNVDGPAGAPLVITAEGISKRSGGEHPDRPSQLGKIIAAGRAHKALRLKIVAGKHWIKIHNNMMG